MGSILLFSLFRNSIAVLIYTAHRIPALNPLLEAHCDWQSGQFSVSTHIPVTSNKITFQGFLSPVSLRSEIKKLYLFVSTFQFALHQQIELIDITTWIPGAKSLLRQDKLSVQNNCFLSDKLQTKQLGVDFYFYISLLRNSIARLKRIERGVAFRLGTVSFGLTDSIKVFRTVKHLVYVENIISLLLGLQSKRFEESKPTLRRFSGVGRGEGVSCRPWILKFVFYRKRFSIKMFFSYFGLSEMKFQQCCPRPWKKIFPTPMLQL